MVTNLKHASALAHFINLSVYSWIHSMSINHNAFYLQNTVPVNMEDSKQNTMSITSHGQSEWPSSINLQTIQATRSVEKREHSYIVGACVNWYSHYWEQYGISLNS